MSNRDSLGTGDLIPQDVVEVFAQERLSKRGHKKRSHSLGRALGWLKGKKRKDLNANGQSLGLGPGPDLALDGHPAAHHGGQKGVQKAGKQTAAPKQDDEERVQVPPLFQENVFIEASRPKYLEDLHTEAQEGLKLMQQEETNNGVYFQDDESTISSVTVQPEEDGGGFMTDSTIPDASSTVSTQSTVSTRSSRSGISRQGSTFRPLNAGKKPEKAKTRRRSRKTVMGIPHHVQKELGLDRKGMTISPIDKEQLPNGETINTFTTDGPQQAAELQQGTSVSLQNIETLQPLSEDQVQQFNSTQAFHRDDLALLHRFGPGLSDQQRPHSLAVPWMTTANSLQQQPPSPVMSMSPQATYLSKIIPNAVMPPAIDVVEISRGRSRNSVRTVSKSSLLLASPASSRASSRASTLSSASKHKPPKLSDSSGWSNSESSETLVSDSSTISSSSTPRQKSQDGDLGSSAKEDKVSVHSSISKASKSTSNGKPRSKVDEVKKDGAFVRSLSVMKSKKAPPPPSRSYSLHSKMKRRSRDLAEVRVISGESSPQSLSSSDKESTENKMVQIKEAGPSPMPARTIDSPGYSADTSSMDDSTGSSIKSHLQTPEKEDSVKLEEPGIKDTSPEKKQAPPDNEVKKIVSPSSGYSSQDGTPTQPAKQSHRSSPRHKKGILVKLQSLFPKSSPAPIVSAPSPLKQPDVTDSKKSTEPPQPQPNPSVDTVTASPSVKALRELFNIPPPPKVHAPPPPPPEVWAHNKRTFELLLGPPAPDNTYAIVKKNPKDRRQQRQSPPTSKEGSVISMSGERKQKDHTSTVELNLEVHKEINERLAHVEPHVDVKENSKVTEKDEKVRVSELLSGMLMKVTEKREQRLAAMQQEEVKPETHSNTSVTEVKTKTDTLPAISLVRVSPAPSPPPPHHPPQPPTKQDTHLAASDAASAVTPHLAVSPTSESLWPPPPPPMEQASGILSGNDVMDLPLPPPPLFSVEGLVIPVQVPPEQHIPSTAVLQDSNSEQLNSACTITSVASVVNAECLKVAAGALPSGDKPAASEEVVSAPQPPPPPAPKLYLMSQGIPPPPPSIPPPPPFAAPTAPVKEGSPPAPKEVSPPPPPKEVSPPPPPKEVSPPSPPKEVSPLPPPKDVSPPPPPKDVSPPAPQEVSPPPPPKEASPPPPKEVSPPPPPKEVSPPPPKEVSPPPPLKEVSPPPPKEVSPPPPPKDVSPPASQEVSPPPPPKDVSPPPPKEVSPPQPPKEVSPPPPKEVSPPTPPKEVSPPPPKEVSPPPPKEVSPPPPKEVSTPLPPKEVPPPSAEEVALLLSQEPASSSVSILLPPQSIPPPPPSEPLPPPEAVPPQTDDSNPAAQEPSPPPPSEIPILPSLETSPAPQVTQEHTPPPPVNILSPPPLPVQAPANTEHQPALLDTENRSQEQTPPLAPQEEATHMTTSLLEVVKLKSVNSSPDPIKPQDQTQPEVIMRTQNPSNQGQAPSAGGEAPQKPIRRSLIITSPTSTSPPAIVTSQPAISKSQTTMVLPTSSSTVISPTKKSPPAISSSPSMNLQEAIRLRTAARSKDGPSSRLSLQSPTSPLGGDFRKSPSSTASFIFSKSTKKVVIETVTSPEANSNNQKNLVAELSSITKSANETELLKKGAKVPPPVAKKPKAKAKEIESSVETEQMQTAGQEAQPESIKGTPEKPNGTAGSVEGGQTST